MWPTPSAISSPSTRRASWYVLPAPSALDLGTEQFSVWKLLLHHRINQRVELAVNLPEVELYIGLVRMPAADYVYRGRVVEIDGLAPVAVGVHLGGELALR